MPGATDLPVIPANGGCLLRLHVQPRASRTEVAGRHGDTIKVRVAAPPVEGAANDALLQYLAGVLGMPRSALTLVRGDGARAKTVHVQGLDAGSAARRLGLEPLAPGTGPG
ncbi:MAG TPA: DUF167 domain-containing protein [Gemmatimonadales bacterium]|nr:DUF167 domain-containing protein [Gemmatimonadales bacterium]